MNANDPQAATREYTTMDRGQHTLHLCHSADDFRRCFEVQGRSIEKIVDEVVAPSAPRAVFVVGSLALGMGSSGSDVDLIVLVDDRSALVQGEQRIANTAQDLQFFGESELLAGVFLTMNAGILVDLNVVIAPEIHRVYARLRRRGPELNETEIKILGRLSSGWLLSETNGYVARHAAIIKDPVLAVYCCTKHYVSALHEISKAARALDCNDIPLALQLGRESIAGAYLAYFASEGFTFLGSKWLAQIGHARGASERVRRHALLQEGLVLLFPRFPSNAADVVSYLQAVSDFLNSVRLLIERNTLFRIAFKACPQIHPL